MFSEIDLDKFYFLSNGLLKTTLFAFSEKMKDKVEKIVNSITNIELSNNNDFIEEYIASMFIPHTDSKKFPKIYAFIDK